jgi:hypothetical protein
MNECLICNNKFDPKEPQQKLCGGAHCEAGFASQSTKRAPRNEGSSSGSSYLQPISYFLKALWIFLNAAIVVLLANIATGSLSASYAACIEEEGIYSDDCTNFSPFVGILGIVVAGAVFYFAGKAGRIALARLREIDSE